MCFCMRRSAPTPIWRMGSRYALDLAASHAARATAFLSEVEPRSAPFAPPDKMQGGIRHSVELSRAEEAERIASLVRATAAEQGVRCEVLVSDVEGQAAGAQLARHARVRDLVVVSVHGRCSIRVLGLVQAVLFGTGRPLMLVPWHAGPFRVRTAVIAWDATPAASRALHDAMPLLAIADRCRRGHGSRRQGTGARGIRRGGLPRSELSQYPRAFRGYSRRPPGRGNNTASGGETRRSRPACDGWLCPSPRTGVSLWQRDTLAFPMGFPFPVLLSH